MEGYRDPEEAIRHSRAVLTQRVDAKRAGLGEGLTGNEDLVAKIEAVLFDADPIGLNFGFNTDEYRPEAQTITVRLASAKSASDVHQIVYEEFTDWFDPNTAGPRERYQTVADAIWALWTSNA